MFQTQIPRRFFVYFALAMIVFVLFALSWFFLHRSSRIPIAGTITVDGMPVMSGVISFTPNVGKGNTTSVSATAMIVEGRYEVSGLGTIGLPRGWYRVTVEGFLLPGRPSSQIRTKGGDSADVPGVWVPSLSGDPASYFSTYDRPFSILISDAGEGISYDINLSSAQTLVKTKRRSN